MKAEEARGVNASVDVALFRARSGRRGPRPQKKGARPGGGAPLTGLGSGSGFFEPEAALLGFFKKAGFFAGSAEPDVDVLDGFADFLGDFAGRGAGFADSVKDFFDFLLDPAFRGAGLGGAGAGFAAPAGFGAKDADGGFGFAGGQGGDLVLDFGHFREKVFFFLGEREKRGQGACVDVCKFHKGFIPDRNPEIGKAFLMDKRVIFEKPAPGEIHLFHVESGGKEEILSDQEKLRYKSLISEHAAQIFLKGRSAVREIGAKYTGKTPWLLEVETDAGGKPRFRNIPDLHFNVSHSGGQVSVAFSCGAVGVDLERKERKGDFVGLAKRFFHPEEQARVVDGGGRVFLELWTAKEAMLKLAGKGIAGGLERARVMENGEGVWDAAGIFLHRFETEICLGAVASFSPIRSVREAAY